MNKTIGKIFSNIVPNADEIAKNIRGAHVVNKRNQRTNIKNVQSGLDAGMYGKGAELTAAQADLARFRNSADMSSEALKTKGQTQRSSLKSIREANGNDNMFDTVKDNVKTYYGGAGVSDSARKTRIGMTAGGVAGVGIGARYLSGGSLTTNSKGERDIAGIAGI